MCPAAVGGSRTFAKNGRSPLASAPAKLAKPSSSHGSRAWLFPTSE
jgi:hypothetical protein